VAPEPLLKGKHKGEEGGWEEETNVGGGTRAFRE